jgi:hypothetical protein
VKRTRMDSSDPWDLHLGMESMQRQLFGWWFFMT